MRCGNNYKRTPSKPPTPNEWSLMPSAKSVEEHELILRDPTTTFELEESQVAGTFYLRRVSDNIPLLTY